MEEDIRLEPDRAPSDLERRLVHYRSRLALEGRHNSVREIDQAIEKARQAKSGTP
jgi:hypothetical protein